jgi:hypothetical protein
LIAANLLAAFQAVQSLESYTFQLEYSQNLHFSSVAITQSACSSGVENAVALYELLELNISTFLEKRHQGLAEYLSI